MELLQLITGLVIDRKITSLFTDDEVGTEAAKIAYRWCVEFFGLLAPIENGKVATFELDVRNWHTLLIGGGDPPGELKLVN